MTSFIYSFKKISIVIPDPKIFLWLAASVADTAAVNPNGIKILLANVSSIFFPKGNLVFSDDPKSLPHNPPHCLIMQLSFW